MGATIGTLSSFAAHRCAEYMIIKTKPDEEKAPSSPFSSLCFAFGT
jgi:hypothetical protein